MALGAAAAAAAPVSFPTQDGWTIAADYVAPRPGRPVIVLAHGVGSSKGEWGRLTERLAAGGAGSLAVDLRGHLGSRQGPAGEAGYEGFDASGEWPRAVEDLRSAARWLESRGVAPARIAFGGASIGANLAALAASERPETPFLLMLSPGPDYRGVPLSLRRGLKALAVASPGDGYAFQTLGPLRKAGAETRRAPAGHGVQMLEDAATLEAVAAWVGPFRTPTARRSPRGAPATAR